MIDREARDLAIAAARFGDALKASDIVVLQVGDVLALTEYFVVMSASNKRLVDALVDEIEARVRDATGRSPVRVEGARENQWVLIDFGDVIVHVFLSEIRDFYEIERLYTDVPKVDWADVRVDDDTIEPTGTD
jgi:ribosome-associated protein